MVKQDFPRRFQFKPAREAEIVSHREMTIRRIAPAGREMALTTRLLAHKYSDHGSRFGTQWSEHMNGSLQNTKDTQKMHPETKAISRMVSAVLFLLFAGFSSYAHAQGIPANPTTECSFNWNRWQTPTDGST